jgi:TonB family protein
VVLLAPRLDVQPGPSFEPPKPKRLPYPQETPKPTESFAPERRRTTPRPFHGPEPARGSVFSSPVVEAPAVISPSASPVAPPLNTSLPILAPPPLKTDNLTSAEIQSLRPTPVGRITTAGFGDAHETAAGHATRGTVRAGEFGDAAAESGTQPSKNRELKTASFGDSSTAERRPVRSEPPTESKFTGVEVLSKPRPVYTDEGRRLGIEGEVLLEVQFSAAGEVTVTRLVRGLGHGLDEAAMTAARAIHFRPAQRSSVPVDSTAVVHIVFQLAY